MIFKAPFNLSDRVTKISRTIDLNFRPIASSFLLNNGSCSVKKNLFTLPPINVQFESNFLHIELHLRIHDEK